MDPWVVAATCKATGCRRKILARGMCSSHYATWHRQQFGRRDNDSRERECGWCGKQYVTKWRKSTACCTMHGRALGGQIKLACEVPASHPSRSSPVPADHPSRITGYATAWPVWYGDCDECGGTFSSNTPTKVYCSKLCAKRVSKRARRGREHGDGDSFRWTQVVALFLLFDRCCAYCRQPIDGQPDPDHVVPLSRGGHNTISNILPACRACNCDKQNHTLEEWAADRERRGKPQVVTAWDATDSRYTHLALRPATPRAA